MSYYMSNDTKSIINMRTEGLINLNWVDSETGEDRWAEFTEHDYKYHLHDAPNGAIYLTVRSIRTGMEAMFELGSLEECAVIIGNCMF